MKLEKAIEIGTLFVKNSKLDYLPDQRDAIKLGIEALERIKLCRRKRNMKLIDYIPGETPS